MEITSEMFLKYLTKLPHEKIEEFLEQLAPEYREITERAISCYKLMHDEEYRNAIMHEVGNQVYHTLRNQ